MADKELHFLIPCPHCGRHIELTFKQIRWKDHDPKTATYHCQLCGGEITDLDKEIMTWQGVWAEVEPPANRPSMGMWVNPLCSPFVHWSDVVAEFLRSRNDSKLLKNFVTFMLAEPWEDKNPGQHADPDERQALIRECEHMLNSLLSEAGERQSLMCLLERRIEKLKNGASPSEAVL